MRRKAVSKLQKQPTKVEHTADAEVISDERELDVPANGTGIEVTGETSAAAVVAKRGRKRGAIGNDNDKKGNESDGEKTVEENAASAPKRGKKPAKKNLDGDKATDIEEEVTDGQEIAKEKKTAGEFVSDGHQEQDMSENETESKKVEKSAAVSKRGRKKAVAEDPASDKVVPVSKRGRKPAMENSNGEEASESNSAKEEATSDLEPKNTDGLKETKGEVSEKQNDDDSVPKTKSISKAPGKRGKKKNEAKATTDEVLDNDVAEDVVQQTKEAKDADLSDDDFQSSSHSAASKRGVGKKHARKNPVTKKVSEDTNAASKEEKDQSTADLVAVASVKEETKTEQPAKRGRKPKNKNEDTEQAVEEHKITGPGSNDGSLKMKEAKVVLNRQDVLLKVGQESMASKAGTAEDSKGKAKSVASERGKATKRGKEKEEKDDAESKEEKPAKVPKKADKSKKEKIPDVTVLDFSSESKSSSGTPWNFKISSWNINGIRAWLEKDGLSYLHHEKPDILCVQETKCSDEKLPEEVKKVDGYHTYWLSGDKDGYSGVGLLTKEEPLKVEYGIGISEHDGEGRVITVEYEKFYLVAAYVPNAGRGLVRLDYRTKWDKDFRTYLKKLDEEKPVILCGDLNVAHEEIDLANPKGNKKNAGFTKEEREGFTTLLAENGFTDTFRKLYPDTKDTYTFWTYMMNSRAKNVGWRLDYFVISSRFEESLCDSVVRKDVHGSDHCPITLFLSV